MVALDDGEWRKNSSHLNNSDRVSTAGAAGLQLAEIAI